ncbi:MAG: glutamate formimidoyltransferase, partial [Chloroflexi bacterium]|nr:glutamate formimidoyltransferase [Chloroflexota bacterium]
GPPPEVIDAIVQAITAVPGVMLLDRHSDADHNRSVVTYAGPPQAVSEAAFAAIRRASELIDLDQHHGEHPRIGATDVVPFVPLSGCTLEECVALARALGERVAGELGIPVYYYEAAATRPERKNLETLRRGQYEGLKAEIETDVSRAPDVGPRRLGTAGATVIGARAPLIAYNVYLTTDDVSVAKKIAAAVRQSSGGLPCVKALGMDVEGRAQVSMNLTDFTRTSVARAVETVRKEAARHGVAIHHTELVGLIPQAALLDAALSYLQLEGFHPEQVLESRLLAAQGQGIAARQVFLDELAAGTPTPGGGSAAAYAAAMAAGLVGMVARLTVGKKKYAAVEARMRAIASQADELGALLAAGVERDAASFQAVLAASRLPHETAGDKATRTEAVERATLEAARIPLEAARQAAVVGDLAAEAAEHGNVNALSDAISAAALALAGLTAAAANVRINAAALQQPQAARPWLEELTALEARAAGSLSRAQAASAARISAAS